MSEATVSGFEELQQKYELDVYGKRGITLVRGQGARLWDDQDREYIDCVGGYGAANLGHGHPRILRAIERQARRLISCPGAFFNDAKAAYLERLLSVAPKGLTRAFLSNSGTESVEAALKFARITTGRSRFIAARRGFHGRTFGAMSATFNPKYSEECGPLVPGFSFVPYNKSEALAETMDDDVAAVILEVVQGEGGVRPGDADYFSTVRALCDQHGALLIIDEVQTGFARTGRLFACEHDDIRPDLLCLAKSIAAGLPMGATLVNDRVEVPIGRHGSTFGGNPLACAVANTVLDVIENENLSEEAEEKGNFLVEQLTLEPIPVVRQVRHRGLMVGLELRTRVRPYLQQLAEKGLLALPAGSTVLRLLPPLVMSYGELETAAAVIRETLQ